jgi:hypothetical protein
MTKILIKGAGQYQDQELALQASPIACAVADAWLTWTRRTDGWSANGWSPETEAFGLALETIELATRESPLRKVKP